MQITKACNSLIKNQRENTIPTSDVLKTIVSLSQEEFGALNTNEKAAVSKLYQKVSDTELTKRPDWVKPFLAFQKIFPGLHKAISKETDPAYEQIRRGLIKYTSGSIHDAFTRMQAFLEDSSKFLDLSNLGLDSLPSFLLTDPRFADVNISENAINKLPNIKIGTLCNAKIYEEMIKQISEKKPKMNLPIGILKTALSFLEDVPLLEENKNLIKATGLFYQERIRKFLTKNLWMSRFVPKDFSLESSQKDITVEFVKHAQACVTAKGHQDASLITVFPKILEKLPTATRNIFQHNPLKTQEERAQEVRAYLADHKAACSSITTLNLSHMELKEIPLEICGLSNLRNLDLSQNRLKDIPPEIGNLTNLLILQLSSNNIESIPSEIGNLTILQELYLSQNSLKDIPPEIGNFTNLQELHLSGNNIEIIPSEIGSLTNLQELHLSGNNIENIPSEIGNLTILQALNLSQNRLKDIPLEIGNLTNLQRLFLFMNEIKTLPSEEGNLPNLRVLYLPHSCRSLKTDNELKMQFKLPSDCNINFL